MKKILYLPGLNSSLHNDRRNALQQYDIEIIAPKTDYEGDNNLWDDLNQIEDIDAIVGSSAGGLVGYYLSGLKEIPALLYNPALPFRQYFKQMPALPIRLVYLQIVLGAKDTDVPAMETFKFLHSELDRNIVTEVHWINNLEHLISTKIFERELAFFMERIGIERK